jgi:hypothetical protein
MLALYCYVSKTLFYIDNNMPRVLERQKGTRKGHDAVVSDLSPCIADYYTAVERTLSLSL